MHRIIPVYFEWEFVTQEPLNWHQNSHLKLLVHHGHRIQVNYFHIPETIKRLLIKVLIQD